MADHVNRIIRHSRSQAVQINRGTSPGFGGYVLTGVVGKNPTESSSVRRKSGPTQCGKSSLIALPPETLKHGCGEGVIIPLADAPAMYENDHLFSFCYIGRELVIHSNCARKLQWATRVGRHGGSDILNRSPLIHLFY